MFVFSQTEEYHYYETLAKKKIICFEWQKINLFVSHFRFKFFEHLNWLKVVLISYKAESLEIKAFDLTG